MGDQKNKMIDKCKYCDSKNVVLIEIGTITNTWKCRKCKKKFTEVRSY